MPLEAARSCIKNCKSDLDNYGYSPFPGFSLTHSSIPLCALINQYLAQLAQKFPTTKFLKSVSTVCIPNYPDRNLPTIFVYYEEEIKKNFVGPHAFGGMNLKVDGELRVNMLLK